MKNVVENGLESQLITVLDKEPVSHQDAAEVNNAKVFDDLNDDNNKYKSETLYTK